MTALRDVTPRELLLLAVFVGYNVLLVRSWRHSRHHIWWRYLNAYRFAAWAVRRLVRHFTPEPTYTPERRDPRRKFTKAEHAFIAKRAGYRCEHDEGDGRCPSISALVTMCDDHIWPHARGGATDTRNAELYCTKHNLAKSDRWPTHNEIARAIARGYYPRHLHEVITETRWAA